MNPQARHSLRLSALAAGLLAAGISVAAATDGANQAASPPSGEPGAGQTAPQGRSGAENSGAAPESGDKTTPLAEHWLDVTPDTIEHKTLINSEGEKLGDVTGVVRNKETGDIAAVVSMGGFLGIGWLGGQDVAVPLKRMHLQANNVILFSQVTKDDLLEQEGAYRAEDYSELEGGKPLGELAGVIPSQQPPAIAFGELDKDGDGVLTRSESEGESALLQNWDEYDADGNDRIDRGEFGLFLEKRDSSGVTPPEV